MRTGGEKFPKVGIGDEVGVSWGAGAGSEGVLPVPPRLVDIPTRAF